jgi:hypothetical protein
MLFLGCFGRVGEVDTLQSAALILTFSQGEKGQFSLSPWERAGVRGNNYPQVLRADYIK